MWPDTGKGHQFESKRAESGRYNLRNLSLLNSLDLAENSFHDEIPQQLSRLSRHQNLNGKFQLIYHIVLTSRALCWTTTLLWDRFLTKNLTSLEELYLSYNSLEGEVPTSLARLTKLRLLGLSVNSFSREFPPSLYNLSSLSLQMLHFGDNQFVGTLPHSTVNLSSQLQRLLFFGNRIGGSIPREISNLVNLNLLDMSNNNLTGSIPDSIGRLANLGILDLRNNLLTGVIPSSIGNLTELVYLYLGFNRLEGNIPLRL
ncbi:hypothetical protein MTR67_014454 [Solanum verrucosum]|uniref:Uncharacterized protein n=1 Tax=Solanum verrucosum TaxID=315347 RepID=A0AAF0TJA7_SOLVR|nr:hypothetical protein MTR67_014454 [Solanum verrucosum]